MLKVEHLVKAYDGPQGAVTILDDISLTIAPGEFVMVMGESGSGKSTFLNSISTLLPLTSGHVYLNDTDLAAMKQAELEKLRLHDIAYIFQENFMVEGLTMLENVMVARLQYDADAKDKALELMRKLNIEYIQNQYPHQVSGGEKQRAAIARALINNPKVLFADEPTAALNPKTAEILMEELKTLNEEGQTIVMVTHSISVASHGTRLLVLSDKSFKEDVYIPSEHSRNFVETIVSPYL